MQRLPAHLALSAALAGCVQIDLLGDVPPEPACPDPGVSCVPDSIYLDVDGELAGVDQVGDPVVAQGGQVALTVSGPVPGSPSVEVEGGDLVGQELSNGARLVIVRPIEESVVVHAEVDGHLARKTLRSAPVDRIAMFPDEDPFMRAAVPVDFAFAREGEHALVVRLVSASGELLLDRSLVAGGDSVIEQPAWDRLVVAATDSIVVDVAADSVEAEIEIAVVDRRVDEILPVAGPGLLDPTLPVEAPLAEGVQACFLGSSGGVALAGLAWRIDHGPDAIDESTGCEPMALYPATRHFRMWAGDVGRAFQLRAEE